jgi:hypothetical protein
MDANATRRMFEDPVPCVPLDLVRPRAARVLWLNHAAAADDPEFIRLGADIGRYEQHLLAACAYELPSDGNHEVPSGRGYADRYGGSGIGLNGGSGRAAFVQGYHVKGVGRTPLVSSLTERAHASGGAYLEESVRDIIFTEVVRAEFPHSAIPILALIATGQTQAFEFPTHTDIENRVLVVRPPFLRPAHYLRSNFVSDDPKEGQRDARRVQWMFDAMRELRGASAFERDHEAFYERWAQQLAYGYVHRLTHGSPTVSNISLDGRLLDFGAMTALPSWADTAVMLARQPFSAHQQLLPRLVRNSAYFFGRHLDARLASPAYQDALSARASQAFQRAMVVETLRLLGLERPSAELQAVGVSADAWWRLVLALITHFERERLDMVERTPEPRIAWDVDQVWQPRPPTHLFALRQRLLDNVPVIEQEACARRCRALSRTRPGLYRHELRTMLFSALGQGPAAIEPDREVIEALIDRRIAGNRRDSRCIPTGTLPLGFAVRAGRSLLLCREASGTAVWAVDETLGTTAPAHRVSHCSESAIHFVDPALSPFEGAVCAPDLIESP